jgi:hypothetical protein
MSSFELFKLGGHLDEKWWLGWGSSQQVPRKQKRPLITECIDAQKKIMINVGGGGGAWGHGPSRPSDTLQRGKEFSASWHVNFIIITQGKTRMRNIKLMHWISRKR